MQIIFTVGYYKPNYSYYYIISISPSGSTGQQNAYILKGVVQLKLW